MENGRFLLNIKDGILAMYFTYKAQESFFRKVLRKFTVLLINFCAYLNRLLRNEGEKLRRDRLNSSINELAQLLPVVAQANRKVDKSTVLRQATNYLRFYKGMNYKTSD